MKKHLIVIGIVALLLTIGFSGCTEEDKFIGSWRGEHRADDRTFFRDGKCSVGSYSSGTWELVDGKLHMRFNSVLGWLERTYTYAFSDNDNKLILSRNGDTQIFERV